ncbi:hypothetical protein SteCoe_10222 [Stentor coeruleus]|uniref:ILEI/PANDER domain-containing protein n=1 Tax=Stentor coeruleus TaxID=5963 RepID=A0A1R2CG26_9CILI|nr:hypothetical protein SteCoe_10222 [Stentor coeruleus]
MRKPGLAILILMNIIVLSEGGRINRNRNNIQIPSKNNEAESQDKNAENQGETIHNWDFNSLKQVELNPAPKYPSENFNFIYSTFKDFIKNQNFFNKLPTSDHRYKGFSTAFDILFSNPPTIMIETSFNSFTETICISNGCSTSVFGHLAKNLNAKLYSLVPKNGEIEGQNMYPEHVDIVFDEPVDFLSVFDKGKIGFLYLNNESCGENIESLKFNRLLEVMAAYPRLSEKAVVMVDGCDGNMAGSSEFVHEFFTNKGWKLYFDEFQKIYIR